MNNPSPLVPQGSLEPKNEGRARVKIAVFFVLAVHGIGLLALLMQGCHKEEPPPVAQATNTVPVFEPPTNTPVEPPPASATTTTTAAPTTPPPPPVVDNSAAPTQGATEYTVANGDSFYTIAKHFKIPTKALTDANPGVDPLRLRPGQKLHVPAPVVTIAPAATGALAASVGTPTNGETIYTVKSGDNLTTIATHLGTSVRALRAANNLKTDAIKVGQKLTIPPKTATPTPPADPASGTQPPR